MRFLRAGPLAAMLTVAVHAQPDLRGILSRVAEEAEVLQQNAPKVLSQETLEQRAVLPPSRFHPRIGQAATQVVKPRLAVREVVSEYSVGTLKDSDSNNLVEFRQVVAVDGRPIQSAESARHALSLGMHSQTKNDSPSSSVLKQLTLDRLLGMKAKDEKIHE